MYFFYFIIKIQLHTVVAFTFALYFLAPTPLSQPNNSSFSAQSVVSKRVLGFS